MTQHSEPVPGGVGGPMESPVGASRVEHRPGMLTFAAVAHLRKVRSDKTGVPARTALWGFGAAMVVGAIVWCTGHRWGAGLAGGAGAALAGWAALVIGAAEWRLDLAAPDADASRSLGDWALAAAGVVGAVALIASFRSAGRDRLARAIARYPTTHEFTTSAS